MFGSIMPRPQHCATAYLRGVPLHVYYMQFSQDTHPMGNGRPPWAAGECIYFFTIITDEQWVSQIIQARVITIITSNPTLDCPQTNVLFLPFLNAIVKKNKDETQDTFSKVNQIIVALSFVLQCNLNFYNPTSISYLAKVKQTFFYSESLLSFNLAYKSRDNTMDSGFHIVRVEKYLQQISCWIAPIE